MVETIRIDGAEVTDMSYVTRQFVFKEGDPVDYSRINLTRKKLYDTRLFKRVEIELVKNQGSRGYIAEVHLNENRALAHSIRVCGDETAPRPATGNWASRRTLTYGNLFGKGHHHRSELQNPKKRGAMFVFLAPSPCFFNVTSTPPQTLFRTRDLTLSPVITDSTGVTIQQQWRLRDFYILSYDYSYRKKPCLQSPGGSGQSAGVQTV